MDFDAQPSSSSSLANVEIPEKIESRDKVLTALEASHEERWDEIEGVQEEKNLKVVSQSESENQNEVEMKCFIDQLPPEMLMEILKHLNVKSLTVSRLVSRKWNDLTREIIQSRDDVEIVFDYKKGFPGLIKLGGRIRGEPLENFIQCFEDSKESPLYTCFVFYCMEPWAFDYADWLKFISDFGQSIKSLRVNPITINPNNSDAKLMKLTEKLRNLLLNQLPKLQVFGLELDYWPFNPVDPPFSNIQLFPASTSSNEEKTFHLANLKVLHLDEYSFSNFPGIVTDLLRAAVNLEKIEPCKKYGVYSRIETFQLLQSLGKLGCLQSVCILLDTDFLSEIQGQSSAPLAFKLKKLKLFVSLMYNSEVLLSDASVFIANLFESIKDTLTELEMDPIGFLAVLQLPKFSKLNTLSIQDGYEEEIESLPSGINLMEIFPLLQNLELATPLTFFFPDDETQNENSCLPKLKTLKIKDAGMRKEAIFRISQVCPNLKELKLCSGSKDVPIKNFPEVGEAIWTHLTKLESLELKIDEKSPANVFPAVDSTFTGFSGEYCIRLQDLIQCEALIKESGWVYQVHISLSKSELETERKAPSILDLKDLRKLQVHCLYNGFNQVIIPETMLVSEECAFKLMEKLAYEIK